MSKRNSTKATKMTKADFAVMLLRGLEAAKEEEATRKPAKVSVKVGRSPVVGGHDRSPLRMLEALENRNLMKTKNVDRYAKKHYESWSYASQRFCIAFPNAER